MDISSILLIIGMIGMGWMTFEILNDTKDYWRWLIINDKETKPSQFTCVDGVCEIT